MASTPIPRSPRQHWPDNLRVLLIVLVVAHHSALTYGHIPLWPYHELPAAADRSSRLLDLLVFVNQTWFMGLFFLISGLFVPGSVDRRGVGSFLRGRLVRLAVPYLIFALVLRPIFTLPAFLQIPAADRPSLPLWYLLSYDGGPTWFLLVLLVFSAGYAALRSIGAPAAVQLRIPGLKTGLGSILLLALVLGAVSGCWRLIVPDGSYWPYIGLPSPAYLPQYLACFAIGILANRLGWIEHLRVRTAVGAIPVALVTGGLAVVLLLSPTPIGAGFPLAIAVTVFAACLMTVLLVLFRTRFDWTNAALSSASANAFAMYVIHAVVLVYVAMLLSPLVSFLPALGRFAVLLVVGGAASWALAALVRRIPAARKVF